MKKYNIFLMIFAIFLMASCADEDLPQPEIQTFQIQGNANLLDEFGEAVTGVSLNDISLTFIRQGFESIVATTSVNDDGTYSFANLPIREYGVVAEKEGFNQVLGSNDFTVSSSSVSEQRMIVDIPENVSDAFYNLDLYLREKSSTEVATATANRDTANPTAQGITTTINGTIASAAVNSGFKRGVYVYFSDVTPTNEEGGAFLSKLVPINAGNTNFSLSVTDLELLNSGFSSGSNVNVAFYGVTLNDSDQLVTIANSTILLESGFFTLP